MTFPSIRTTANTSTVVPVRNTSSAAYEVCLRDKAFLNRLTLTQSQIQHDGPRDPGQNTRPFGSRHYRSPWTTITLLTAPSVTKSCVD